MDKPEYGKTYALTGGSNDKCISNGNTWAESEVNPKTELEKTAFESIYQEADQAGQAAVNDKMLNGGVEPMVLVGGVPGGKKETYYVADGPCGFAWVNVRPGNCSFANWLKKYKGCDKSYYGGVDVWISKYGQSIQKKEIYARAFAEVLEKYGIKAYADSRLD